MSVAASRAVLRQSQFMIRRTAVRHSSSSSEAANKAKESASNAASKAQQGLSRVTSSAGPAIAGAASNVGSALRKVGGRTGKVIAYIDTLIPPTVYYSKVGIELAKLVFRGQKMTPPNLATFQAYFEPVINVLRNPSNLRNVNIPSPQSFLGRLRSADKKDLAFYGVTAAEVLGFFTVGEIIGRFNVVGYRGEPAHGH
ncbi:mitochondrial F1F0-ATP synthase g subunit [Paecilomyces variotii No. 5]|uniref:Mitochondrial F1F0-ATP synthase g subunit n=1 Tax=Byssochlamys spectabilis (strain No. 5 / NBRC 109023) TaxID=1356009 RepID=V5GAX9_BYSSN|nr:mitochondrial F1F0-ATP synthase g subunit [Paecilomyces variotii No. 5]